MSDPEQSTDPAPPNLEEMAKQYLDMWQAQLAAMTGDADTAKAMAGTMAMMGAGAQAFADAARQAAAAQGPGNDGGNPSGAGGAPGAAAAADAAPGGAGAAVDELARRLAAAEERIARLESELAVVNRRFSNEDSDSKA